MQKGVIWKAATAVFILTIAIFLLETSLEEFRSGESDAPAFLQLLEEVEDKETAALAVVGNALLNLDEFVVKN